MHCADSSPWGCIPRHWPIVSPLLEQPLRAAPCISANLPGWRAPPQRLSALRAARAAARAQAARQVSRLPGRGSGVGRFYPRGPAAWLQARGAGSPARGRHQPRPLPLAEGGAAYRGQAGADRGGGRQAATPASGLEPVRHAAGAAPCRYGAPARQSPTGGIIPPPRIGGKRWFDSVPWDKGCNGAHFKGAIP